MSAINDMYPGFNPRVAIPNLDPADAGDARIIEQATVPSFSNLAMFFPTSAAISDYARAADYGDRAGIGVAIVFDSISPTLTYTVRTNMSEADLDFSSPTQDAQRAQNRAPLEPWATQSPESELLDISEVQLLLDRVILNEETGPVGEVRG